jgi:outer membrane protein assembly factor BamE (lipoprotein component of BamABCDE complex)
MVDKRDRVVWVHGDQLEHDGHCVISTGMTRSQVLEKMGNPCNPLRRVEPTDTEVNYYPAGVSVALVNQRLVFSTVK